MNEVERWTYDATEQQAESVRLRQQVASLEARLAATVEAGMVNHGYQCGCEGHSTINPECDCGATLHNEKVRQVAQGGTT